MVDSMRKERSDCKRSAIIQCSFEEPFQSVGNPPWWQLTHFSKVEKVTRIRNPVDYYLNLNPDRFPWCNCHFYPDIPFSLLAFLQLKNERIPRRTMISGFSWRLVWQAKGHDAVTRRTTLTRASPGFALRKIWPWLTPGSNRRSPVTITLAILFLANFTLF